MKFGEKVVSSDDHGYDKSTGYFTARSDGLYLFYMQLKNESSSKSLKASIRQRKLVSDGAYTEKCRGFTNKEYLSVHCTTVLNLSAGDQVYVQNHYAGSIINAGSTAQLSYFLGVKLN